MANRVKGGKTSRRRSRENRPGEPDFLRNCQENGKSLPGRLFTSGLGAKGAEGLFGLATARGATVDLREDENYGRAVGSRRICRGYFSR